MPFVKMHGLRNDYVYINGFEQHVDDPAGLARQVSDRHAGIGSDGLILLLPASPGVDAHLRMRMFNADGSESEMCGNGIRCVCKLAHDDEICTARPMRIETGAGVLSLSYEVGEDGKVSRVSVNMGAPVLELAEIPVDAKRVQAAERAHEFIIEIGGQPLRVTLVSMGNPHAVMFIDNAPAFDLAQIGLAVERHEAFPQRINFHVVQVHARDEVTMRTWERGSGITQACGTGAAAVCVAAALTGRTDRRITAHLPGGDLELEWNQAAGHVIKTGPAVESFRGIIPRPEQDRSA